MKHTGLFIITFFILFAQTFQITAEANSQQNNIEVAIKYYDKTLYYPDTMENNPVLIHISIKNKGPETFHFKLADDRMFNIDFQAYNIKNKEIPKTEKLIKSRTTSRTVYFREISLESGEEYSFVEDVKNYLKLSDPSIYYFNIKFFPELYKSKITYLISNKLTLDIRPSPDVVASVIPLSSETVSILKPEQISPDKIVSQTIIARQKSLWNQYFLYMDIEQMLMRDNLKNKKYNTSSAEERVRMLENYKLDLMQDRIDKDIVAIPVQFEIQKTVYNQTEGIVTVLEWFKNDNFLDKKKYEYLIRQRDGIWRIYDYRVENLGTE